AITVDVVNLEWIVIGEQAVAWIGTAFVPEDLAVESDGGQATDLVEVVRVNAWDILRDQYVRHAVAVQIAKGHIASRAEVGSVELIPKFRLGVVPPETREFLLTLSNPQDNLGGAAVTG